jgi:lactate dehydrogenase-like 2-hydroxyacid dehydrogenase
VGVAEIRNPSGSISTLVTKRLPGERWIGVLEEIGCRVEILEDNGGHPLSGDQVRGVLERGRYVACIGQLNEPWNAETLGFAAERGLRHFSTFAVGFDNIDLPAATRLGIPIGNTPGVLTEATAELAVALTLATARRVVEMDRYTREGVLSDGIRAGLGVLEGLTVGDRGEADQRMLSQNGRAGVLGGRIVRSGRREATCGTGGLNAHGEAAVCRRADRRAACDRATLSAPRAAALKPGAQATPLREMKRVRS